MSGRFLFKCYSGSGLSFDSALSLWLRLPRISERLIQNSLSFVREPFEARSPNIVIFNYYSAGSLGEVNKLEISESSLKELSSGLILRKLSSLELI